MARNESTVFFALIVAFCLFSLLLSACGSDDGDSEERSAPLDDDDDDSLDDDSAADDDDAAGDDDDDDDDGTTWTFVVFMAADNDLIDFTEADKTEMKSVGSTARANILLIYDGILDNDSRYYEVQSGNLVEKETPGELNMGDPQTLVDAAVWAFTQYPADKYALTLWNHGSGWHKGADRPRHKSICEDMSSGDDWLETEELVDALSAILSDTGLSAVDLLGFDACLMQMTEIAYAVRHFATVQVGSEETEEATGWDYEWALSELVDNPGMSPADLATVIVESFVATPDATLSAVDLTGMDQTAQDIDAFAAALIAEGGLSHSSIKAAFDSTLYFDDFDYIDLFHFAETMAAAKLSAAVTDSAQALMNTLDQTVIEHGHGLSGYENEHGLSIYFPDEDYSWYDPSYQSLDFAADTAWDDLIAF